MIPHGAGTRAALSLAPLPAIGGSLLVMRAAGASGSLLVQQIAVSVVAVLLGLVLGWTHACVGSSAKDTPSASTPSAFPQYVVIVAALVAVALPMMMPFTDPPHRWIIVGGLRLYMAALVLPAAVVSLGEAWPGALASRSTKAVTVVTIATMMTGAVLAAHPDASQVTALAGAMTVVLLRSWRRSRVTLLTIVALAACSWYAWQRSDPLLPVPYVEGVLDVAASGGRGAWLAAIVSLAVPPIVLVWQASAARQPALLASAVYYVIIGMMAWRQLTPMPLLGFGASPILGYFFMAGLTARNRPRPD